MQQLGPLRQAMMGRPVRRGSVQLSQRWRSRHSASLAPSSLWQQPSMGLSFDVDRQTMLLTRRRAAGRGQGSFRGQTLAPRLGWQQCRLHWYVADPGSVLVQRLVPVSETRWVSAAQQVLPISMRAHGLHTRCKVHPAAHSFSSTTSSIKHSSEGTVCLPASSTSSQVNLQEIVPTGWHRLLALAASVTSSKSVA